TCLPVVGLNRTISAGSLLSKRRPDVGVPSLDGRSGAARRRPFARITNGLTVLASSQPGADQVLSTGQDGTETDVRDRRSAAEESGFVSAAWHARCPDAGHARLARAGFDRGGDLPSRRAAGGAEVLALRAHPRLRLGRLCLRAGGRGR